MKSALYGLVLAFQFLTRLPLPLECPWNAATRRWALRAYPLVGLGIGALLALAAWGLGQLALPTPLVALALLSLWVALSGGLHLDGVMDLADALGSNQPLERRLEIMKDPQVGSFGLLALVFLLAWKGALLWAFVEYHVPLVWLFALPAIARCMGGAFLVLGPCLRPAGMAYSARRSVGNRDVALSLVPVLAAALFTPALALWLLVAALFTALYRVAVLRAFKGINGDMVGALIEGGELWLLLTMWSFWWFATA
ncbi:adenosylcobinamide-GDP ribazoletransferase [Vreelandella malpeensis]|uniref:Adenosylcobinamide-GDP ribazoletransferase n=1 Tax=Vreelandella malpeensis TaxID=1172368 RepID=A0ABS8DV48_9GAMM|nr:adenosylcobinamide-GDP ribazoletransferase [Halomonas malpeensis]